MDLFAEELWACERWSDSITLVRDISHVWAAKQVQLKQIITKALAMRGSQRVGGLVLYGSTFLLLFGCGQDVTLRGKSPSAAKPRASLPFRQRPPVTLGEAVAPIPFEEGPYWSKPGAGEPSEKFSIPLWWARLFGGDEAGPRLLCTHHRVHSDGFHQLRFYAVHNDQYQPLEEYRNMMGWIEEPYFFRNGGQEFILITLGSGGSATRYYYGLLWWNGREVTDLSIECPAEKLAPLIEEQGWRLTGQLWIANEFGTVPNFSVPFVKPDELGTNFPPNGYGYAKGEMRIVRDSQGCPVRLAVGEYQLVYPERKATD